MSELNINRKTFLELEELKRLQSFILSSAANKVTLGNTTDWGIVRTDFTGTENDFRVDVGSNSGSVKIANKSYAIGDDELLATQMPIDNIAIPNDSVWRWLRVSHKYRNYEVGKVSVNENGELFGIDTDFTETLRGQSTDVPTNIKFLKSDLSPATNSGYFQVVDILDGENAIITSNIDIVAESELYYVNLGSTPIDEVITNEQSEGLYFYDDCLIELVDEEVLDTPPTTGFVQDKTFYVARVQNDGVSLTIEDKRSEYWQFNISGISDKLDKYNNLSDLTDTYAARENLGGVMTFNGMSLFVDTFYLSKYGKLSNYANNPRDQGEVRLNIQAASIQSVVDLAEEVSNISTDGLRAANNLSDLDNTSTARSNISVYSNTEVDGLVNDKADKSNVLEKNNTTPFTPSASYHPATKLSSESYADNLVADTIYQRGWDLLTYFGNNIDINKTYIEACKVGKIIYVQGEFAGDGSAYADDIILTLPSVYPTFNRKISGIAGNASTDNVIELYTESGTRNIRTKESFSDSRTNSFQLSIPII